MSGTARVFRAELYRLTHSRLAWVALFLVAVLAATRVLAAHIAISAEYAQAVSDALLSGRPRPEAPPIGNAYAPLVEGWLVGLTLGTVLLLIHSARALAGDRETGVLRLARTRSASRSALVIGRFLIGPILVLSLFAVSGLGAGITAASLFEFGPLVIDGFELISEEELLSELGSALLAALPPLIATYAFGLFISALGRTAAGAVGFCLAVFLGFDLFKGAIGDAQHWIFASFVPSLVDKSCLKQMAGIAAGYSDSYYEESYLHMSYIVPWPQALLFLSVACWLVSRRSI